jgi:succinate dehydrogenase / fumarate reductase flavoprotein subunit
MGAGAATAVLVSSSPPKNYVHLDVRPEVVNSYLEKDGETRRISPELIEEKLSEIVELARTYLGVDPLKEPMPVQPTAHYAMGGIPTDVDGRVILDAQNTVLPGLYAVGEAACVSVHGANRLGTNSLVDLVVFGRRSGKDMADYCSQAELLPLPEDPAAEVMAEFDRIRQGSGGTKPYDLRNAMQSTMTTNVGVFRTHETMSEALTLLKELRNKYSDSIEVDDKGKQFNTDLLEAWELGCLLELAEVTAFSALARTESRGGHARDDFQERDDDNWLKHTLCHIDGENYRLDYKPVTLGRYEPKKRVY